MSSRFTFSTINRMWFNFVLNRNIKVGTYCSVNDSFFRNLFGIALQQVIVIQQFRFEIFNNIFTGQIFCRFPCIFFSRIIFPLDVIKNLKWKSKHKIRINWCDKLSGTTKWVVWGKCARVTRHRDPNQCQNMQHTMLNTFLLYAANATKPNKKSF